MDLHSIERRRETRVRAEAPIQFCVDGFDGVSPGQLIDLSHSGAGLMTTNGNAPGIGERVQIEFQYPLNNEDMPETRVETGLVCSVRHPQRDVSRVGIRFLQTNGEGCLSDEPVDGLDNRSDVPTFQDDDGLFGNTSRWAGVEAKDQELATVN